MHDLQQQALSSNELHTLSNQRPPHTKRHHVSPHPFLLLYYSSLYQQFARRMGGHLPVIIETDRSLEIRHCYEQLEPRPETERKKGRGRTHVLHYQTSERGSPPIFIISYSQIDRCDDRCPWLGTYHFGIPVPGGV